jgi:transcriptional repressor BetI
MPKVGMEEVRRRQLIDATIRTIHELGYEKVTLGRVARTAGISPGLVPHYFRDKQGLLEATMRHIAEELRMELSRHLAEAHGPRERLTAILNANFAARCFAPEIASAWLAFWGQAHSDPNLTRMQRVMRRRLRSNLARPLRELVPDAEARRIAMGLSIFIDGLSLRHALGEEGLDRERAHAFARDYLDIQLANAPHRAEEAHHAQPA